MTFSALASWTRSFFPQTSPENQATFTVPLPAEIWDVILDFLANDDLLQAACVSRAWNSLSIAIVLRRHGASPPFHSLDIPSFAIQAIHISCVIPRMNIHTLRCAFPAHDVLRRMRSVREVVAKSFSLTSLSLDFACDFLVAKSRTGVLHRPETLMSLLCDILRTVVRRIAARVVFVVVDGGIIKITLGEDDFLPSRCFAPAKLGGGRSPCFTIALGNLCFYVDNITAVSICSVRNTSCAEQKDFTLIVFPTNFLTLDCTINSLCLGDLSSLLPNLDLPTLRHLTVKNSDGIDPVVLEEFMGRHSRAKVEYE
ncbi:hypothetical protein R3P38DRAFT_1194071 [Favolaschia claudopus]|uniref:F-box domain-containing protein n=1 Tax=Favolaschia claudopus TaxID=2862362 RepID=A0AAW0E682_9AGAR